MPAKQEAKTYQLTIGLKKQYSHVLGSRKQYKKQHPYPKLGGHGRQLQNNRGLNSSKFLSNGGQSGGQN